LQALLTSLLVGGIYGLLCVGLGLIFSVMRVINFAWKSTTCKASAEGWLSKTTRDSAPRYNHDYPVDSQSNFWMRPEEFGDGYVQLCGRLKRMYC